MESNQGSDSDTRTDNSLDASDDFTKIMTHFERKEMELLKIKEAMELELSKREVESNQSDFVLPSVASLSMVIFRDMIREIVEDVVRTEGEKLIVQDLQNPCQLCEEECGEPTTIVEFLAKISKRPSEDSVVCQRCNRKVTAQRFTIHLAKCMDISSSRAGTGLSLDHSYTRTTRSSRNNPATNNKPSVEKAVKPSTEKSSRGKPVDVPNISKDKKVERIKPVLPEKSSQDIPRVSVKEQPKASTIKKRPSSPKTQSFVIKEEAVKPVKIAKVDTESQPARPSASKRIPTSTINAGDPSSQISSPSRISIVKAESKPKEVWSVPTTKTVDSSSMENRRSNSPFNSKTSSPRPVNAPSVNKGGISDGQLRGQLPKRRLPGSGNNPNRSSTSKDKEGPLFKSNVAAPVGLVSRIERGSSGILGTSSSLNRSLVASPALQEGKTYSRSARASPPNLLKRSSNYSERRSSYHNDPKDTRSEYSNSRAGSVQNMSPKHDREHRPSSSTNPANSSSGNRRRYDSIGSSSNPARDYPRDRDRTSRDSNRDRRFTDDIRRSDSRGEGRSERRDRPRDEKTTRDGREGRDNRDSRENREGRESRGGESSSAVRRSRPSDSFRGDRPPSSSTRDSSNRHR